MFHITGQCVSATVTGPLRALLVYVLCLVLCAVCMFPRQWSSGDASVAGQNLTGDSLA